MRVPKISGINMNGNKPIITGAYDTILSKYFRVIFGERVYTLGIDEELAAENDIWELDLSSLAQPLDDGAYELVVEAEGYDSVVRRAEKIIIITPINVSEETPSVNQNTEQIPLEKSLVGEDPKDVPKPMPLEQVRMKVSLIPLISTLTATAMLALSGVVLSWKKA